MAGIEEEAPLTWAEFERVRIVAGTIVSADPFPEARKPAYRIRVDLGPDYGIRKTSAQVTALYRPEELVGRQVLCVVNFPPKQVGPMRSELLLTGLPTEAGVVLATVERPVPNGTRLA